MYFYQDIIRFEGIQNTHLKNTILLLAALELEWKWMETTPRILQMSNTSFYSKYIHPTSVPYPKIDYTFNVNIHTPLAA